MGVSDSEVTPVWTFSPVSDTLTLKSEALVTSGMDLTIGTSGGVEIEEVVGGVESVKIVEVKGMEIRGSKIPTKIFGRSGGMDDIGMEFMIGDNGGDNV